MEIVHKAAGSREEEKKEQQEESRQGPLSSDAFNVLLRQWLWPALPASLLGGCVLLPQSPTFLPCLLAG